MAWRQNCLPVLRRKDNIKILFLLRIGVRVRLGNPELIVAQPRFRHQIGSNFS